MKSVLHANVVERVNYMYACHLNKLKECREEKNYSQGFMARKLHISKTFYSTIENGKRRLSYDNALKIANIFHMTTDELFKHDFEKSWVQM